MYVRFQGRVPNEGTSSKLGIFQLAIELRDRVDTPSWVHRELQLHLSWLSANLKSPDILDKDEHFRAICWFKSLASEPLQHVWAMKALLDEFGYVVDVITSRAPGIVIYEDDWQVVAKPFRKTTRNAKGSSDAAGLRLQPPTSRRTS